MSLFKFREQLSKKKERTLTILSFLLPIGIWCVLSYVPFIYHPQMKITNPGDNYLCEVGDTLDIDIFEEENIRLIEDESEAMQGVRVNPTYLPAPHEVGIALVTAFTTEPRRDGEPWFYQSVLHSIRIVFLAFFLSSIVGVPLGILCGAMPFFEKLFEPVVEFIRYFPAPVFATLSVAILGLDDAPKIAIIIIGTFFQQLPMIANTVRSGDAALIEAAETLGATKMTILCKVIVPSVLPKIYRDMRILLGWAWTYLIVAEVVGTASGISYFINLQAKYRNFENVYAAIIIIGCIGLGCDMFLGWIEKKIFPWESHKKSLFFHIMSQVFGPKDQVISFSMPKEDI